MIKHGIKITCSSCNKKQYRIAKKINSRNYYYTTAGQSWKSSTVCHKCKITNHSKKYISVIDESYEIYDVFHTTKKCRSCNSKLEISRYFNCKTCKPVLTFTNEDYIYA